MIFKAFFTVSFAILGAIPSFAHKHIESESELAIRREHVALGKRALESCRARKTKRDDAMLAHRFRKRENMINSHMRSMKIEARDSLITRDWIYEGGSNSSCILTPEGEEGPYCKSTYFCSDFDARFTD
jgi:hypothetical protein